MEQTTLTACSPGEALERGGAEQAIGVMSRYSTSARNFGSSHVAFGSRIGLVSFDVWITTGSSFLRIWPDTVRDQPVPTLPE